MLEKLNELFSKDDFTPTQFMHGDVSRVHWKTKESLYDGDLDWELVDRYGGEEQGSDYYKVYKFTDKTTNEECYVYFQGWYASYDGASFEEWYLAKPVEKTIIDYVRT